MELDFDICRAVGVRSNSDGGPTVVSIEEASLQHPRWGQKLCELLDVVGERSKRAQGLGKPVTSGRSIDGNCRVYLLANGHTALGVLKVGPKRLFVARDVTQGLVEITPLCVLDFYIVEGQQRGGLGRKLFDAMLSLERGISSAAQLAYDRPSPKLLSFLRKHFGLAKYTPQSNNFVVFDAYFSPSPGPSASQQPARRTSNTSRSAAAQRRPAPFAEAAESGQVNVVSYSEFDTAARTAQPPRLPSSGASNVCAAGMPSHGARRACPSGEYACQQDGTGLEAERRPCRAIATRSPSNRSASPLHHAGRCAVANRQCQSPLVQAMTQGLRI